MAAERITDIQLAMLLMQYRAIKASERSLNQQAILDVLEELTERRINGP